MSVFEQSPALRLVKRVLKRTIYRPGTVARILAGPLRGYRYEIHEDTGWATIYGGWEPDAAAIYQRFVKPGAVVLDLGANTGIHSLLFAKLAGPTGRVISFEPLPRNVRWLEGSLRLNRVKNVEVKLLAVSDAPGQATFKIGRSAKQGSLVGIGCETGEEVVVKLETLDNLIEGGMPAPDFVKVDIEGAESAAMQGYARTIERTWPTFAIDLHGPEQGRSVGRFLDERGYALYRLRDESARKVHQEEQLHRVRDYMSQTGGPDEVWGTIIAVHPSRA